MIDKSTLLTEELLFDDLFAAELGDDPGWREAIDEELVDGIEAARQYVSAQQARKRLGKSSEMTRKVLRIVAENPDLSHDKIAYLAGNKCGPREEDLSAPQNRTTVKGGHNPVLSLTGLFILYM